MKNKEITEQYNVDEFMRNPVKFFASIEQKNTDDDSYLSYAITESKILEEKGVNDQYLFFFNHYKKLYTAHFERAINAQKIVIPLDEFKHLAFINWLSTNGLIIN